MQLVDGDQIIGMEVVTDATSATLVTVTEKGYGKRTSIDEYKTQSRGGKGVITIKTSARNGCVVDIKLVSSEEDLMFITDKGKILRTNVGDLSIIGRNTQGVRLMVLDAQERIGAVATLAEKVEDEIVADALDDDSEE
jgi:DNA gyrase subunit A